MTTTQHEVTVFWRPGCGFCMALERQLADTDLTIHYRNIWEDPVFEEELISETGRRVVPVLRVIDKGRASRWIPESRDIIEYLVNHHSPN